mmetsp:Transcript_6529/g.16251  ORF Transcript_6529/g.16251 Transcript_6529/m.16251 type:complete len:156 (-) Transcript_6529:167-634(-)
MAPPVDTSGREHRQDDARRREARREAGGARGAARKERASHDQEMLSLQQRLEGHYSDMKNFIRTRAEPTIFYLPKKHTSKTEKSLAETRTAIEQKIRALKGHLKATSYEAGGDEAEASVEDDEEEEEEELEEGEEEDSSVVSSEERPVAPRRRRR